MVRIIYTYLCVESAEFLLFGPGDTLCREGPGDAHLLAGEGEIHLLGTGTTDLTGEPGLTTCDV